MYMVVVYISYIYIYTHIFNSQRSELDSFCFLIKDVQEIEVSEISDSLDSLLDFYCFPSRSDEYV